MLDYGFKDGDNITIIRSYIDRNIKRDGNILLYIKTLTDRTLDIYANPNDTAYDLKVKIRDTENIPIDQQRLIFAGIQLEDNVELDRYGIVQYSTLYLVLRLRGGGGEPRLMGIAAGGLINQKIYLDTTKLSYYNKVEYQSTKIDIINTKQYGINNMDRLPISAFTYSAQGYPWYKIYDEFDNAVNDNANSLFNEIESINAFKDALTNEEMCCVCMDKYVNAMFEPCGHKICSECLVNIIKTNVDNNDNNYKNDENYKNNHKLSCHLCRGKVESKSIVVLSDIVSVGDDCGNNETIKLDENELNIKIIRL